MFVLNLSVSFACSLFSAARAYELPADDMWGILKGSGGGLCARRWSSCAGPGRADRMAEAPFRKGPETVTQD